MHFPLSKYAKLVSGIILLSVPTIMYGGLTLLGLLMNGTAGFSPGSISLNDAQSALWRAGHAHAGVWVILSLVLQILIDATNLNKRWEWTARTAAPLAAVATPAGFFGLAFAPAFRWLLYFGGLCLLASVVITGVGLILNRRDEA
ncbi:MAG: hypothetical protein R3281_10825 [Balneolaceae bacterium]|nr:hypothetical protein [Balneolaceae bacterium]